MKYQWTLEVQIGQLAQIVSTRLTLPNDNEKNPVEHLKAISMRSEKRLEEDTPPKDIQDNVDELVLQIVVQESTSK